MGTRLQLQEKLVELLGSNAVFFQPPETIKLTYPCIIYNLDDIDKQHADNHPYRISNQYAVMLICKDPDTELIHELARLQTSSFNRYYVADGLHHYVYRIYSVED